MEISKMMQCLSAGNPPHYNIWFGSEQKIIDLYLEQIKKLGNKIIYLDNVKQAVDAIGKKSFDPTTKCFVVIEDNDYLKAEGKWESVKSRFAKSKHLLVIRYSSLNKTTKFYKDNKPDCTEFVPLGSEILVNYIKRDLAGFDDNNCEKLCNICSNDYGRIILESNKISSYAAVKNVDYNTSFNILLSQDVIYRDIGDITFKLTDAVLYGDIKGSLRYLTEALLKGEPAIMISSILYNGFRNMLAVMGLGKDKSNAAERTGLAGWQIKQVFNNIGGYSISDVERNMLFCQQVEQDIKMGIIDQDDALEYLICGCLR